MKERLPIGNDVFRRIREDSYYYVDKTLFIKEFIELQNTVTLITRPRRFGKTVNITMLRDFFDINRNSKVIFEQLAIMDTEYANQINQKPVIFISFKDCSAPTFEQFKQKIKIAFFYEYVRYYEVFQIKVDFEQHPYTTYYQLLKAFKQDNISWKQLESCIHYLMKAITHFYGVPPLLLIDKYDEPILNSSVHGYQNKMLAFLEKFYFSILGDREFFSQALILGIYCVSIESIFLNIYHITVCTILDKEYAPYFGFTEKETRELLNRYDLKLDNEVAKRYAGYLFGGEEMYNPWSILHYADRRRIVNYWVNTSRNELIFQVLVFQNKQFHEDMEELLSNDQVRIHGTLEASFLNMNQSNILWGLLVNAGYLAVKKTESEQIMLLTIPNEEVRSVFEKTVIKKSNISKLELNKMVTALTEQDLECFIKAFSHVLESCTNTFRMDESAYHMLFLVMCLSLRKLYRMRCMIECGRCEFIMISLSKERVHIVIEFKGGGDIEEFAKHAWRQLIDNLYDLGLYGEVLCIGASHIRKRCELLHMIRNVSDMPE